MKSHKTQYQNVTHHETKLGLEHQILTEVSLTAAFSQIVVRWIIAYSIYCFLTTYDTHSLG